jgi:hypothetical protein
MKLKPVNYEKFDRALVRLKYQGIHMKFWSPVWVLWCVTFVE